MPDPRDRDDELLMLYLEGRATPAEQDEVERRLQESPAFAERLAVQARLSSLLNGMARERSKLRDVEQAVEGDHELRARLRTRRVASRPPTSPWMMGLVAAAAILVMVLILSSLRSEPAPRRGEEANRVKPRVVEPVRERAEERLREIEVERKKLLAESAVPEKKTEPNAEETRKAALAELEARKRRIEEELRAATPGGIKPPEPPPIPAPAVAEQKKTEEATRTTVAKAGKVGGEAFLVQAGAKTPLRAGQDIPSGQGIETGSGASSVEVIYPDQTKMELSADTEIAELAAEAGKRVVVRKGVVRADVKPQPRGQPMIFETAQGEAVVLGTTLKVVASSDPKEGTTLEVTEGKVRFKSKLTGKTVEVAGGHFAMAAAGLELAPLALPTVLYSATFDDGRAGGWTFSAKHPWSLQAQPGGVALASPKDLKGPRNELMAVLATKAWQDGVFELDLRPEYFEPASLSSALVFLRHVDSDNTLWFEYMLDKGVWKLALLQKSGGTDSGLGESPAPALEMGRSVRLRIELKGEDIRVSLDGREALRGKTTLLGPGRLALCPMQSRFSFDNIKVTSLPQRPKPER